MKSPLVTSLPCQLNEDFDALKRATSDGDSLPHPLAIHAARDQSPTQHLPFWIESLVRRFVEKPPRVQQVRRFKSFGKSVIDSGDEGARIARHT